MTTRTAEHWATYNDDQAGRPVRPLCADVLAMAGDGRGRRALDLGCGAGIETLALLTRGWRVHAVDLAPGTPERVLRTTGGHAGLTVREADLGKLRRLPAADLVHAGYALPYLPPTEFARVWQLIRGCLRPGGWLAVNLLGDRDGWAGAPGGDLPDRGGGA